MKKAVTADRYGNSGTPPPPLEELDAVDWVVVMMPMGEVAVVGVVVDWVAWLLVLADGIANVEVDDELVDDSLASVMTDTVPSPEFAENTSPLAGSYARPMG